MKMGRQNILNTYYRLLSVLAVCVVSQFVGVSSANAAATLDDITFSTLAGDQLEVTLHMSGVIPEYGSFTIDNPARIALDLPGTDSKLKTKVMDVGVGLARTISTVEAGGRTRVVINLARLTQYNINKRGDKIVIRVGDSTSAFDQASSGFGTSVSGTSGSGASSTADAPSSNAAASAGASSAGNSSTSAPSSAGSGNLIPVSGGRNAVQDVQFRRGAAGEGRVVITVSNPNTVMDMMRRGSQIIVTLQNIRLPEKLERRLDVLDFGTPVRTVDVFKHGNDVRIVTTGAGVFEHLGYQSDNRITLDVKKFVKSKESIAKKKKKDYIGERLSLNFQNIEVRAVLQLIADFTGVNMVTSDAVTGNVTLRLKNVPWDQALDIILKTKGLGKRQKGNVMLVAPIADLAAQEKLELEAQKQVIELAPVVSETIQVNYAKASELVPILEAKGNSLLSGRGNVAFDERTNKILIQDTSKNIDAVVALIEELDVPIRQVLVDSRIVTVTTTYAYELGVQFGISASQNRANANSGTSIGTSGSIGSARSQAATGTGSTLNVGLPAGNPAGAIGLAIARLPFGTLLDLELSAAEEEGQTEVISSPRVITSNQHKAKILSGRELPYTSTTISDGVATTTVQFKEVVLELEVTPQITPDDRINLDLFVKKDSPDTSGEVIGILESGNVPIFRNEVQTRVLVDNGETIVLGGVYEQTQGKTTRRVPLLADIPILGVLFRNSVETNDKSELLIFVTPKIIKDDIAI